MTANLMEAVSGLISPDLVQKAAGASGESPEGTRAALLGSVPTLFAGLAHRASTPSGTASVVTLVTRAATKPKEAGGQALLTGVFGDRAEAVTESLANHAGVRPASAAGILALIGPLVLGAVGKEVGSRGLSGGGLAELLLRQKKAIMDDPNTPKELGGALGLGSVADLGGPAAAVCGPTVSTEETRPAIRNPQRPPKWPIMLLPALLLGVLALWGLSNMFKGRPQMPDLNGDKPALRQGVQERQGPPAEPSMNEGAGAPIPQIIAPTMAAPEVAHPESALPATTLPDAKLHFEVASTKLTPGSNQSVDELARFLERNPDAAIHIEGFADPTGNAGANEALSASRAKAVKDALVAKGIDASRIETSGMGDTHPVAPNGSAHDRAQNRRAAVTRVR